MDSSKIIFVTGGTGNQGGAVVRNLSSLGFALKVLTRNPNSTKALQLIGPTVQVIKGDLNNAETYRHHLRDVYGVFSVQTFVNGIEKEINQGITLANLASAMGVKHFLYSSIFGADLNTKVPHMESKFKIESHIQQLGLPFTIVRPTSLYENFLIPEVKKGILKGKLVQPINRDTVLQYIAAEDIGKAAAKIFQQSETYLNRVIPLAAEQLSTQEVADTFSTVLNQPIEYKKLPTLLARLFLGKSIYKMFKFMDEKNRFSEADVEATRKEFPNFLRLKTWIEKNFKPT